MNVDQVYGVDYYYAHICATNLLAMCVVDESGGFVRPILKCHSKFDYNVCFSVMQHVSLHCTCTGCMISQN